MQNGAATARLSSMTHQRQEGSLYRRALRSRRLWIWLAVAAAVPLVVLAIELSRWRRLPEGSAPISGEETAAESREAEQARESIRNWMSDRRVAGLSVCAGTAGEVLWCSALGYADIVERSPLTAQTSMRLGSVSKPVTSILLARLVERGLLDLDQPIGQIKPDLPAHLHPVTLRQLASHTAGVRHYRWHLAWPPHETWSRVNYESVTESLTAFSEDPLAFPPGSSFTYSSHGYTLLGAVLEHVGDQSFGELLAREIAGPLGLESIELDSPQWEPHRARHYEIAGNWYRDALVVDNSRGWPGAGLRSSAADLVRLVSGLGDLNLISADTLELVLTPQPLPDGSPNSQNYALGWRLAQTQQFLGGHESYRVAHHGGMSSGSSSFVAFFPDQSFAVVVLTNSRVGSGPLSDLAFEVAEPFMAKIVD